jgi:hypothetical protein
MFLHVRSGCDDDVRKQLVALENRVKFCGVQHSSTAVKSSRENLVETIFDLLEPVLSQPKPTGCSSIVRDTQAGKTLVHCILKLAQA